MLDVSLTKVAAQDDSLPLSGASAASRLSVHPRNETRIYHKRAREQETELAVTQVDIPSAI